LCKIGNALKDTGSTFLLLCEKSIHDAGIAPFVLNNTSLFLLNNFLYNCALLNLDLTPGKVGYVAVWK